MGLRDQLIAKGLASKKRGREVERELKQSRKTEQGRKKKQRAVAAEERAAAERFESQRREERARARDAYARARAETERVLRIRQIVLGNTLPAGGKHAFYHRSVDGRHLCRLEVPEPVAFQLRCGDLAIAGIETGRGTARYCVIPARAARTLEELAPDVLVHWVHQDGSAALGLSDPALALSSRDWDPDLRAHRHRES